MKNKDIVQLYTDLFQYPTSATAYRDIERWYRHANMTVEADVVAELLRIRYLEPLEDHNTHSDG